MIYFITLIQASVEPIKQAVRQDVFWELVKYATPIVVALASAVTALWRAVYNQMNDTKKELLSNKVELSAKLDKCEEKHKEQQEWAVNMSNKVGKLEGMMEGHAQAREDLKNLSNTVIQLLNDTEGKK